VPNLFVGVHQTNQIASADHLDATDAVAAVDSPLFKIIGICSVELTRIRRTITHFVGMTRVLVDSWATFKKSAGLPRFTPSTTLPAPRSSTQSPQLTQVSSGLPVADLQQRADECFRCRVFFLLNSATQTGLSIR
jgi:hypothetical protein